MYPHVTQFETRQRELEERLALMKSTRRAERTSSLLRRFRSVLFSLRKRGRAVASTRGGVVCAILTAAITLAPPGAAGAGSSATYSDPVGDAGLAPDIASLTLTKLNSATLGVRVELASPTTLDRYTWVLIGIDTDRNQRTGGMHGSEAIVFVNGEQAVLSRLRGRSVPVPATLEGTELTFRLPFAQIGARTFDFAVATLRQDADVAPDRGVFSFPPASRHVPQRDLTHLEKREPSSSSSPRTSWRTRTGSLPRGPRGDVPNDPAGLPGFSSRARPRDVLAAAYSHPPRSLSGHGARSGPAGRTSRARPH